MELERSDHSLPPDASGQLPLCFHHSAASLQNTFEKHLGRPVSLVLTENSRTMLSARMRNGILHLRLHQIFVSADLNIIGEIAQYLKNRKNGMPGFMRFVKEHEAGLPHRSRTIRSIRTAGRYFDLRELFEEVNSEYFDGTIDAAITWGTRSPRSAVRKRTLGSYSGRSNIIRINPVLDRKNVPRYYIAYVVYHEMLHAAMGTPIKGKRRSIHPKEFRVRERQFKDFDTAEAWENRGGHGPLRGNMLAFIETGLGSAISR